MDAPQDRNNDPLWQIVAQLQQMNRYLAAVPQIAASLAKIAAEVDPRRVVGVDAVQTLSPHTRKDDLMKAMPCKLIPASPGMKAHSPLPKGETLASFGILDNGNGTITILGTDAAGNHFDISAVATLSPAPTSDAPAVVTVGPPTGMTFPVAAATSPPPAVGATATITATATWTDGSNGPFSASFLETIQPGPVTGIIAVPSVP